MSEYPKRKVCKVDYPGCECGHEWYDHETSIAALFNFLRGGGCGDGKCKICECPFYKKDKEKEWINNG